MGTTSIEWTDKSWPMFAGCKLLSPGCANCYAARLTASRLKHLPKYNGLAIMGENGHPRFTGKVRLSRKDLAAPLSWKKPSKIFVNDMSDLFYEEVSDLEIAAVFGVMAACPQHTFQVLTKRADRMQKWFHGYAAKQQRYAGAPSSPAEVMQAIAMDYFKVPIEKRFDARPWPLPNVLLGVSAENQKEANRRLPALLATPAAGKFVSLEPLLEDVDISPFLYSGFTEAPHPDVIDWVIVGGESGPGARPFHLDWARSILRQCRDAKVACFVKQLGSCAIDEKNGLAGARLKVSADAAQLVSHRLRHTKGSDMSEWPSSLRVREFPEIDLP